MSGIKIYIDDRLIETYTDTHIEISAALNKIAELQDVSAGTKRIRAAISPANRSIMGYPDQILGTYVFNQTLHTAKVVSEDEIILTGKAMLAACETFQGGDGEYLIDIIPDAPAWYESACRNLLKDTPINFEDVITGDLVRQSWTWNLPVRFFPVQRDRYDTAAYENEIAPTRVLTYEDYHPFLNIRAVLDAIAGAEGYSIVSEFMDGEFFRSLYMSGFYPEKDIETLKYKMNFLAGRFTKSSAAANSFGVVDASAVIPVNSLGNIVDSADSYALSGGKRVPGAFNNGGCFKIIDSRAAFVPVQDVVAGFEYRFVYTSNFEVVSETGLKGFNRIKLDDGIVYDSNVVNTLVNRREMLSPAGSYVVVIFDYDPAKKYQLHLINGAATIGLENLTSAKSEFSCAFYFTPKVKVESGTDWISNCGVYDALAYKEATQNVMVDVTLRSKALLRRQNQPVYFDFITFSGAKPGEIITLGAETTVRPIFYANPTEGSSVTTAEIFAHPKKQIELFRALKHLFNLRFYSDTVMKKIYVEPLDKFYSSSAVIDWSGKLDVSQPVIVAEMGSEYSKNVSLLYTDEDGSVMRWNEKYKVKFAKWRTAIKNVFAKDGEENLVNPLFAPTINVQGAFPQARSASLIKTGDRDRRGDNYDDGNLNFAPKIVSYRGMQPLKSGEAWGYPSYSGTSYPMVVFNSAEQALSLCFDDYNGVAGLHFYYDSTFGMVNAGKKITLSLLLEPGDIAQVLYPGWDKGDYRATFKIRIGGEDIYCRLSEIECYSTDPAKPARCVFITGYPDF